MSEFASKLNTDAARRAATRSRSRVWSLHHLPRCAITLLAAGAVLAVVAGVASGGRALLGVAVGTAIVGLFFTLSTVIIAVVGARAPRAVLVTALGVYLFKIVALGVVLTTMPRDGAVDTRWMAGAVCLGLFAWLGAHLRHVWTAKLYYVDPG